MDKKSYYAFFDVDETIINIKSMFSFLQFYYKTKYGNAFGQLFFYYKLMKVRCLVNKGLSREAINIEYYKIFSGKKWSELLLCGEKWFAAISKKTAIFNEKILHEIAHHKQNGAGIILVSGSFHGCLDPLVKKISADECLCSTIEIKNGFCTGKILSPPVIGEGKKSVIKAFLKKNNFENTSLCYAYGDHYSDIFMLETVGNPVVVGNCPKLLSYAKDRNWKILLS